MKTRIATIQAEETLGASGTKIIDLNIQDVISRIMVNFFATNADTTIIAHPAANVEKIELVDGSDVLFSLTGYQAQGVNFYDRNGKIPYTSLRTYDSGQRALFGMDFGRYLFDPVMAFDPKKFINPQLKITWDRSKANAACAKIELEVLAQIFDEDPPSPTGFLMNKEIYSYTVAENGYEYIDLPTDYVIRQIFAKAFLGNQGMTSIFDAFKLSEDNDKRIPLDMSSDELERRAFEEYGFVKEHVKINADAGPANLYGMPTDSAFGLACPEGAIEYATLESSGGGSYIARMSAGAVRARGLMIGLCPHGTVPLLPKPGPEIADWYDVTKIGSLKLRVDDSAGAGTTPTGEILTSQYRPYAA